MFAAIEDIVGGAGFDRLAAEHHDRPVGDFRHHAHVVGDEQNRHPLLVLQHLDQVEDLALDGDVERRRRFVGDQELWSAGERHGDHHALAHAAGKLMRIVVETALGIRDTDLVQQTQDLGLRLGCGDVAMAGDRFGDLLADREDRIERGHRLLEDHGDLVAAHLAHLF